MHYVSYSVFFPRCSTHNLYVLFNCSFSCTRTVILFNSWRASISAFRKCFSHISILSACLAIWSSRLDSNTIRSSACFTMTVEAFFFSKAAFSSHCLLAIKPTHTATVMNRNTEAVRYRSLFLLIWSYKPFNYTCVQDGEKWCKQIKHT